MARFLSSALFAFVLVTTLSVPQAWAGSNDITLQRYGTCRAGQVGGRQSDCFQVAQEDEWFEQLSRDLGLVFSPKLNATAETLGQAGFAFQIDQNISLINNHEEYWIEANVDEDPAGTLLTTQLHFRKGLPLSLEIGGVLTFLWESQLMAVGSEIRWALHEDYLWPVPDLAVRGFVNTVLGSSQLSLTTAGADVVAGVPIGVGNVMNITPYFGYNLTAVIAASRLIDASPTSSLPPVIDPTSDQLSNQPEFVFDLNTQLVHQGMGGVRFQFAVTNIGFEAIVSSKVQTYSFNLGLEF